MPEQKSPRARRPRERQVIKLDATPEEVARNIFAAAKPPDQTKRISKRARKPPTAAG